MYTFDEECSESASLVPSPYFYSNFCSKWILSHEQFCNLSGATPFHVAKVNNSNSPKSLGHPSMSPSPYFHSKQELEWKGMGTGLLISHCLSNSNCGACTLNCNNKDTQCNVYSWNNALKCDMKPATFTAGVSISSTWWKLTSVADVPIIATVTTIKRHKTEEAGTSWSRQLLHLRAHEYCSVHWLTICYVCHPYKLGIGVTVWCWLHNSEGDSLHELLLS